MDAEKTTTYQLTQEEAAAVEAIRAHSARESMRNFMAQHILDTAADYYRWMRADGYGSTFSTFCDDYDYQPPDPEMSRKPIYDVVVRLIASAHTAAENIAN